MRKINGIFVVQRSFEKLDFFNLQFKKVGGICTANNVQISNSTSYSDLPNNCAANVINFLGKKHLHNLIRTYTFINF